MGSVKLCGTFEKVTTARSRFHGSWFSSCRGQAATSAAYTKPLAVGIPIPVVQITKIGDCFLVAVVASYVPPSTRREVTKKPFRGKPQRPCHLRQ